MKRLPIMLISLLILTLFLFVSCGEREEPTTRPPAGEFPEPGEITVYTTGTKKAGTKEVVTKEVVTEEAVTEEAEKPEVREEELPYEKAPEFPWPPPKASAFHLIPNSLLLKSDETFTLNDIAARLVGVLDSTGYTEKSYYAVPDGFALVTRMEQINEDGTPKEIPDRWSVEYEPSKKFRIKELIKKLFTARRGFYRIIVFVVTPHPFTQKDQEIDAEEAKKWLVGGPNKLPPNIAKIKYSTNYSCTALVYEFEQTGPNQVATLRSQGKLTGYQHLLMSGIWEALGG